MPAGDVATWAVPGRPWAPAPAPASGPRTVFTRDQQGGAEPRSLTQGRWHRRGGASPVSTAGGRASPGRTGTAQSPLHLLPNKTPDLQRDSFFSFHCHLQERKSSPSPDEGRAWGASRESGAPCHGARWPEPSRSPGEVSPVSRAGSRPGRGS